MSRALDRHHETKPPGSIQQRLDRGRLPLATAARRAFVHGKGDNLCDKPETTIFHALWASIWVQS